MLSEKDMEEQIAAHPERFLGERQLSVVSRQFRIGSYIFDLLFEDRHGGKLIVEIQKGTLDRNHTYKILDYYDEYRENHPHEFIDVMVIANQITAERKKRLHALGVEFRELPEQLFTADIDLSLTQVNSTVIIDPIDSRLANNELVNLWGKKYPEANPKFLSKHLYFCSELRNKIMSLSINIEEKFGKNEVAFFDGKRCFFAIHPQSSKVTLAPITLELDDIKDMELTNQVREVADKKYKIGGLFRVDFGDTSTDDKINVAFELAKRAFSSNKIFEKWNMRSALRS